MGRKTQQEAGFMPFDNSCLNSQNNNTLSAVLTCLCPTVLLHVHALKPAVKSVQTQTRFTLTWNDIKRDAKICTLL